VHDSAELLKPVILVVDDQRENADLLAAVLTLEGYEGLAAYSAVEALALLPSRRLALVITDVIMPGMNGVDFAIAARELMPALKVLLMSGDAASPEIVESARRRGFRFPILAKPMPTRLILAEVRDLLSS
jgi:DNA-binding NtrC family response regulator